MLGDDNAAIFNSEPDTSGLRREIAQKFNMQSKNKIQKWGCIFLRYVWYARGDGTTSVGPDWIRLRNRYEVTNGQHETDMVNLHMRNMSYCMNLGKIEGVTQIIKKYNYPIEPLAYYEPHLLIPALMSAYELNEYEVMKDLDDLLNMMFDLQPTNHVFKHWSNRYTKKR